MPPDPLAFDGPPPNPPACKFCPHSPRDHSVRIADGIEGIAACVGENCPCPGYFPAKDPDHAA